MNSAMYNALLPEPSGAGAEPRWVHSCNLADLASIYEPDVNLCIAERSVDPAVDRFVNELLADARPFEVARTIRFEQFDGRDLLPADLRQSAANSDAWRRDVITLTALFFDLFEAELVGLRLRLLDRPMCPRFHTDFVPVRMVCAYGGPGTEWLPEHAVDRRRLGSGAQGLPDERSGLIRSGGAVSTVPTQAIALMKGERWEGNEGRGAVHRSPRIAAGENSRRLLLTLDLI
jgi:Protein of unknown function (DUF1826)